MDFASPFACGYYDIVVWFFTHDMKTSKFGRKRVCKFRAYVCTTVWTFWTDACVQGLVGCSDGRMCAEKHADAYMAWSGLLCADASTVWL